MTNRRQRRNRVAKTSRDDGRGPSGPISAVPRDDRPRAGQPRNVIPRHPAPRQRNDFMAAWNFAAHGTITTRPVIDYQPLPPGDPGEWAEVIEYWTQRVAQKQQAKGHPDNMDTDPPENGTDQQRAPRQLRPPVPKFSFRKGEPMPEPQAKPQYRFNMDTDPPGNGTDQQRAPRQLRPPVPKFSYLKGKPVPEPQAKPQYGLTAANHDPVVTQPVEIPFTHGEPAVAGFSVDDRAKEHLENDQLLKAIIFQGLLDKLELLLDKVASSTNEGLHEETDQIRIGLISFFSFLGEREGMCTRYDAIAQVYENEVNAAVKANRAFGKKVIDNSKAELQMLKDLSRNITGPPRRTIGQTGSVPAYCSIELAKLAPQEHARQTSWLVDIPSGLDVTISLAKTALNHSVIKAAIKARSNAGEAAANLPDWLHAAKGDILRVLNEYEVLYRKQKAAFELSVWSSGQDQQKLEDIARLKALHSALFGPCFQSMGRTVMSELKQRYLPTFTLFVQDRRGWSEIWEPIHRGLQKALKLESPDGSLVCPVTEFELASFLELTQEEKDLLAGTDIEDLIDYGEFE
ncbi:hypothetical protein LTR92_003946 [Exophiala xenobiotica]|nr:hypothetical protein LTR92_003946 [Exophiala xenobiotica]